MLVRQTVSEEAEQAEIVHGTVAEKNELDVGVLL